MWMSFLSSYSNKLVTASVLSVRANISTFKVSRPKEGVLTWQLLQVKLFPQGVHTWSADHGWRHATDVRTGQAQTKGCANCSLQWTESCCHRKLPHSTTERAGTLLVWIVLPSSRLYSHQSLWIESNSTCLEHDKNVALLISCFKTVQARWCRCHFIGPRGTMDTILYNPCFIEKFCGSGYSQPFRDRHNEMLSLRVRSSRDASTLFLERSARHFLKANRDDGLHPSGQRRWTHQDRSSMGSPKADAAEGTGTSKKKDSARHKQTVGYGCFSWLLS